MEFTELTIFFLMAWKKQLVCDAIGFTWREPAWEKPLNFYKFNFGQIELEVL